MKKKIKKDGGLLGSPGGRRDLEGRAVLLSTCTPHVFRLINRIISGKKRKHLNKQGTVLYLEKGN